MHITAPSSAKQGERVTISVSGAPAGTEQIKFNATGNSGFDIISTTSGSASFNLSLDFSGTTTLEILAQDKFGATLASASHSITVKDTGFDARRPPNGRLGGGAVSGPSTATVGDTINFTASGSGTSTTVRFSAANAEMGWMTPVSLSGGSASGSARLLAEGQATIYATFYDDSQTAVHEAVHVVQVSAGEQRRPNAPGRLGMGGSLSGIAEAIRGTVTEIYAQGSGEAEQVEFSVSNAEMGWMMPVNISPGGSTSASVTLSSEGTATIFANFKDKMGNLLGTAQHLIRVLPDTSKSQGPTDMASLMNARAADILNRLGRKP